MGPCLLPRDHPVDPLTPRAIDRGRWRMMEPRTVDTICEKGVLDDLTVLGVRIV